MLHQSTTRFNPNNHLEWETIDMRREKLYRMFLEHLKQFLTISEERTRRTGEIELRIVGVFLPESQIKHIMGMLNVLQAMAPNEEFVRQVRMVKDELMNK